jgi:hypothetical protein
MLRIRSVAAGTTLATVAGRVVLSLSPLPHPARLVSSSRASGAILERKPRKHVAAGG